MGKKRVDEASTKLPILKKSIRASSSRNAPSRSKGKYVPSHYFFLMVLVAYDLLVENKDLNISN